MSRFLVTAGSTREPIDRVRDWGNIFTGATGLKIAQALSQFGPVDLLTSNRAHLAELATPGAGPNPPILASAFTTHGELNYALESLLARHAYDAIFMTAAVSDYGPRGTFAVLDRQPAGEGGDGLEHWLVRNVDAPKVKSTHPAIAVLAEPTEKLIDRFRRDWAYRGLLFKFKLEVGIDDAELRRIGQASRLASGADYLVANTLSMVTGPSAGAWLLGEGAETWVKRADLPAELAQIVRAHLQSPGPT